MKIAVAAEECDPSAEVAYGGGRAPFFLIFDEEGDLLDCLANPFSEIERHAGYEVSRMMGEENVGVVVAGVFGPAMISGLSAQGIRCFTRSGAARDAVLRLPI